MFLMYFAFHSHTPFIQYFMFTRICCYTNLLILDCTLKILIRCHKWWPSWNSKPVFWLNLNCICECKELLYNFFVTLCCCICLTVINLLTDRETLYFWKIMIFCCLNRTYILLNLKEFWYLWHEIIWKVCIIFDLTVSMNFSPVSLKEVIFSHKRWVLRFQGIRIFTLTWTLDWIERQTQQQRSYDDFPLLWWRKSQGAPPRIYFFLNLLLLLNMTFMNSDKYDIYRVKEKNVKDIVHVNN